MTAPDLDRWLEREPRPGLSVLVLVGDRVGGQEAAASEVRRRLGIDANVVWASAPHGVKEPYAGLLDPFLGVATSMDAFRETLSGGDVPARQAVPRAVAGSMAHLLRARARLLPGRACWIVSPADGLTMGGQRVLEELAERGQEPAAMELSVVITLSLPESMELLVALRRRLAQVPLDVVDVGSTPAPAVDAEGLAPAARRAAEVLALASGAVPTDVLVEALLVAPAELQGALASLARAALLRERSMPEVATSALRHRIAEGIPAASRAEIHGRLHEAFARAGADASVLAYHAARSTEPSRAVGPLIEVADRARGLGEGEVAVGALREAYLFLDAEQWYRKIEILERCAEVLTELGQFTEAIDAYAEITDLAALFGDADRPDRLFRIAASYRRAGRLADAGRSLERAAAILGGDAATSVPLILERSDLCLARGALSDARELVDSAAPLASRPGERLRVLSLTTRIATEEGRMDRAIRAADELLTHARQMGDDGAVARAHFELGHVHYEQSFFDRALEHYHEAGRLCEALGERSGRADALGYAGMAHYERGDLEEALALLRRAQSLKEREGDLRGVATVLNNLGAVHAARGEHGKCIELLEKCLEIMRGLSDEVSQGILAANLAAAHATLGREAEAAGALAHAEAALSRAPAPHLRAMVAQARGEVAWLRRDLAGASDSYEEARAIFEAAGSRIQESVVLVGLAEVARRRGDDDGSARFASRALAIASEVGHPGQMARARLALAEATWRRAPLRAEALAKGALEQAGPSADPDFVAHAMYLRGIALRALGRSADASALVHDAAALFRDAALRIPAGRERDAYLAHPRREPVVRDTGS